MSQKKIKRKSKGPTFEEIEQTPLYQETRRAVVESVTSGLRSHGSPQDLDAEIEVISQRMRDLFGKAFGGVKLPPEAIERIAAAEKKAKQIARRMAFPGLYQ